MSTFNLGKRARLLESIFQTKNNKIKQKIAPVSRTANGGTVLTISELKKITVLGRGSTLITVVMCRINFSVQYSNSNHTNNIKFPLLYALFKGKQTKHKPKTKQTLNYKNASIKHKKAYYI